MWGKNQKKKKRYIYSRSVLFSIVDFISSIHCKAEILKSTGAGWRKNLSRDSARASFLFGKTSPERHLFRLYARDFLLHDRGLPIFPFCGETRHIDDLPPIARTDFRKNEFEFHEFLRLSSEISTGLVPVTLQ